MTNQITNARISLVHGSLRIVDHLSSRGMSMTAIAVLHPRIVRIVGSAIHLHRARYLLQLHRAQCHPRAQLISRFRVATGGGIVTTLICTFVEATAAVRLRSPGFLSLMLIAQIYS